MHFSSPGCHHHSEVLNVVTFLHAAQAPVSVASTDTVVSDQIQIFSLSIFVNLEEKKKQDNDYA